MDMCLVFCIVIQIRSIQNILKCVLKYNFISILYFTKVNIKYFSRILSRMTSRYVIEKV